VTKKQRMMIAYHEAGHAVVARELGVIVRFIAMFPTDEFTGAGAQTESAAFKRGRAGYGIETDVKMALAGPAAQARVFPDSIKKRDIASDQLTAQDGPVMIAYIMRELPMPTESGEITLSDVMMENANSVLRRLGEEASALVAECWPAIERGANALTHRDLLLQSDLDELIAFRR
jgi:ATP-dependent Zn protease